MGVSRPAHVVAVDGGGSKTDAVLLDLDGRLLASERGPGSSPQIDGLASSLATVDAVITALLATRPKGELAQVSLYLSGLDLPAEIAAYRAGIGGLPWAIDGVVVENDLHALLRAGADEPDAVAIVCGTGMNAIGVRRDGAQVRFPALGGISGDWGGGSSLGGEVLWHAARAADGRGPDTLLGALLLEELGLANLDELVEDLHFERRPLTMLAGLAPLVFRAAGRGDAVAISVVERQADEVLAYARACLTRLGLRDAAVPVVIGGGVARSRDPLLVDRIVDGLARIAPNATLRIVDDAPVLGAGLLALSAAGAAPDALARAREELTTADAVSARR
ncbi:MAG: N-acetylglucosamine kinase [Micrococcales bacterium]|nr:N-acetylglucosamine kinase [Micrococcales bacterium]OJX69165.1 MAG: N-acetylglucosamine kinase [Micrococcales bacterium 72-143]